LIASITFAAARASGYSAWASARNVKTSNPRRRPSLSRTPAIPVMTPSMNGVMFGSMYSSRAFLVLATP